MSRRHFAAAFLFVTSLAVSPVWAHPGHSGNGFSAGVLHPLTGVDHIIAMIAVGLWAAQMGGRATLLLPAAFVGFMSLGALAGRVGMHLPYIEAGVAASVLVLGLMIAASLRLPTGVAATCIGLFAICHGHAHGTEFASGGSWPGYAVGFILMTIVLHSVGIGAYTMTRLWASEIPVKLAGGLIAAAGIVLVSGL